MLLQATIGWTILERHVKSKVKRDLQSKYRAACLKEWTPRRRSPRWLGMPELLECSWTPRTTKGDHFERDVPPPIRCICQRLDKKVVSRGVVVVVS